MSISIGAAIFAAVFSLGVSLSEVCVPAGPDDPPEWDYKCPMITFSDR